MGATVSIAEPEDIPLEQRRACLPGDGPSLEGIVQLLKSKVKFTGFQPDAPYSQDVDPCRHAQ
jgi:hypothetical protein